jgi:hypothetical protein
MKVIQNGPLFDLFLIAQPLISYSLVGLCPRTRLVNAFSKGRGNMHSVQFFFSLEFSA